MTSTQTVEMLMPISQKKLNMIEKIHYLLYDLICKLYSKCVSLYIWDFFIKYFIIYGLTVCTGQSSITRSAQASIGIYAIHAVATINTRWAKTFINTWKHEEKHTEQLQRGYNLHIKTGCISQIFKENNALSKYHLKLEKKLNVSDKISNDVTVTIDVNVSNNSMQVIVTIWRVRRNANCENLCAGALLS